MLYDRTTQSIWYPLSDKTMDAVSGPKRNTKIPFIEKPPLMTLGEWRKLHPDTTVMLPPE